MAGSRSAGTHTVMKSRLILATLLGLISVGHAAAWDIDQLMQSLALVRSSQATFSEKKFIAILDKPVESSGELFYNAPDRLEKRKIGRAHV